jgi:hypothetical protein
MTKLYKKSNAREDIYAQMYEEANKHYGPTRKEPMDSPLIMYILPDLSPMQKQINICENTEKKIERIISRRSWKHAGKAKCSR